MTDITSSNRLRDEKLKELPREYQAIFTCSGCGVHGFGSIFKAPEDWEFVDNVLEDLGQKPYWLCPKCTKE